MRLTRFILSFTLLALVAGQALAHHTKEHKADAKPAFAPVVYKHRVLPNGLEVYSVADRTTPTVAIQVWYRVGSKDDPQGRSGFAHLFEHMLFKSTKNMPSEMMDRLTEDIGGENNATTLDDATVYFETIPSNYLETLLWAEADRMASLNVDQPTFNSERDVVKEEYRARILAPPYGRLFYAMTTNSFTEHPYKRPGIGSIEDLDAATIEDVRGFHQTFYRPDNAVLIVAGDFEQEQLDSWVDKYFASIPKPSPAIPRVTVKEPKRAAAKKVTERAPNVPLPGFAMTWHAPAAWSDDAAALEVLSTILGQGESSRLYQSLVYKSQVATDISVGSELYEDLGLFIVLGIMASGHEPAEAQKLVTGEIESLKAKLVTPSELEKAKNLIITSALRERETNEGKAFALGDAIVLQRDPNAINTWLAKIQAVTATGVQKVLRKYLAEGKPMVLTYLAAEEEAKPAAAPGGAK